MRNCSFSSWWSWVLINHLDICIIDLYNIVWGDVLPSWTLNSTNEMRNCSHPEFNFTLSLSWAFLSVVVPINPLNTRNVFSDINLTVKVTQLREIYKGRYFLQLASSQNQSISQQNRIEQNHSWNTQHSSFILIIKYFLIKN